MRSATLTCLAAVLAVSSCDLGAPDIDVPPLELRLCLIVGAATDNLVQATVASTGETVFYDPDPIVSSVDVESTHAHENADGSSLVVFWLTPAAAERFAAYTRDNTGARIAVVLGEEVVTAPVVRAEVKGVGVIEGGYTKEHAEEIAKRIMKAARADR